MIDKLSPTECALCGSCADACPTDAISFQKEYLDFHYPLVDPEKCVSCGLCEKACPVLSSGAEVSEGKPEHHVYAARNPDGDIRRNSSSGGVFWAMAQCALSQGWYVCGAVLDEDFRVHHSISNRESDVRRMMGSKYAQSDLSGIYKQTKSLLRAGETVLFTGCPCQIAGLHSFLGRDYENLITVDIICHGTPSNTILRTYLSDQEKKNQSKIKDLCFRDKKYGWHLSSIRIGFENGREYISPITVDPLMRGYFGATVLKESCYSCRFKNFRSGSDLTIGDFWGAEIVLKDLDDNTGLSAVIVNSERGAMLLHQCGLDLWEQDMDTVIRFNRNLIDPTRKNPEREAFYAFVQEHGLSAAIRKKLAERPTQKLRRQCIYALRCIVRFIQGREKPLY